jgi:hypothetical protein
MERGTHSRHLFDLPGRKTFLDAALWITLSADPEFYRVIPMN